MACHEGCSGCIKKVLRGIETGEGVRICVKEESGSVFEFAPAGKQRRGIVDVYGQAYGIEHVREKGITIFVAGLCLHSVRTGHINVSGLYDECRITRDVQTLNHEAAERSPCHARAISNWNPRIVRRVCRIGHRVESWYLDVIPLIHGRFVDIGRG